MLSLFEVWIGEGEAVWGEGSGGEGLLALLRLQPSRQSERIKKSP